MAAEREELTADCLSAAGEGSVSESSDGTREHKARHHLLQHKLSLDSAVSKDKAAAEVERRSQRKDPRVSSCKQTASHVELLCTGLPCSHVRLWLVPSWQRGWGQQCGGGSWWLDERRAEWVRQWTRCAKMVMWHSPWNCQYFKYSITQKRLSIYVYCIAYIYLNIGLSDWSSCFQRECLSRQILATGTARRTIPRQSYQPQKLKFAWV